MTTITSSRQTAAGVAYDAVRLDAPWAADTTLPVLFQHGLGLDRTAWNPWVRTFLASRTVVTVDLRGHGQSGGAWAPGPVTLDDCAADVLSVLDDCGIERCHYVGESFGGTLGLHLAATAGARVASVTACSTGWKGAWFHNVRSWESLLATGGSAAWSQVITAARFDLDRTPADLLAWGDRVQRSVDPAVVWTIAQCLLECNLTDLLPTIEAPVLAVLGDSPFVDQRNLTELVRLAPRAEAVRVPRGRHGIVLSHWRECAEACLAFLGRTERSLHSAP